MCGRVVWVWDAKTGRLVKKFDDGAMDNPEIVHVLEKERYNVPPSSHLPVLDGRTHKVAIAKWGFPISQRPNGVFNTRIETAAESPMWRGLLGKSHCIFPVQGFYEWRQEDKRKRPFYVHRADGEVMLLAGLIQDRAWEGTMQTFGSVVTCAPNPFMEELHDRMPVVLEANQMDAWLSADVEAALDLAVPAADVLACHEVSPDVGNTRHDDPRLMDPIGQTGLGAYGKA